MKRSLPILLGFAAYVVPAGWAFFELDSLYATKNEYGYVCGLPALSIMLIAGVGVIVLSGIASTLSYLEMQPSIKEISMARKLEFGALLLPLISAAVYIIILFTI